MLMYSTVAISRCHSLSLLQSTLKCVRPIVITVNTWQYQFYNKTFLRLTGVNSCCTWSPRRLTIMLCILYSEPCISHLVFLDPFLFMYTVRAVCLSLAYNMDCSPVAWITFGCPWKLAVYYSSQYDNILCLNCFEHTCRLWASSSLLPRTHGIKIIVNSYLRLTSSHSMLDISLSPYCFCVILSLSVPLCPEDGTCTGTETLNLVVYS